MKELERRKAATVERWYVARTVAEATPLVHVGFDLLPPHPLTRPELESALGAAVLRLPVLHPFLSTRVQHHDGSAELELYRVEDEFRAEEVLSVSTAAPFVHALDSQLESTFDLSGRLWGAWLHLPPSALGAEGRYTKAYAAVYVHHALADGVAVCGVARTLVLLLNNPQLALQVPQGGIPLPLDARVSTAPSALALASAAFTAFIHPHLPRFLTALYAPRTQPYMGATPPPPLPRRSLHTILQIPPAQLAKLLALGRENGLTFTALLHTLMWCAMSPLVDPATQHLYTSVPASLLPLMYPSGPAPIGGCYVAPIQTRGPPAALPATLAQFLAQAKPYMAHLKDPRVVLRGAQAWGLAGMLSYEGMIGYLRKQFVSGTGRNSFAISNLRTVAFSAEQVRAGWVPTRGVFTQPMLGSSATLLADVISVSVEGREGDAAQEGCTVVFCWEKDVLSEEEAEGIIGRTRDGWEWLIREADKQAAEGV
ncbi:hypothetical protein CALCODRAFT_181917 [Calocera cornea HHB12733]|uniref:Diacylglycerol O-acyltransferase n=1 Tax=Calocera cornea HHB12733 TaxID=1353952 RepID=A0A165HRU5_9BASI|nr:hypothetical protein CALCODRAFT_181917 [Calocera cornea HHB12733]